MTDTQHIDTDKVKVSYRGHPAHGLIAVLPHHEPLTWMPVGNLEVAHLTKIGFMAARRHGRLLSPFEMSHAISLRGHGGDYMGCLLEGIDVMGVINEEAIAGRNELPTGWKSKWLLSFPHKQPSLEMQGTTLVVLMGQELIYQYEPALNRYSHDMCGVYVARHPGDNSQQLLWDGSSLVSVPMGDPCTSDELSSIQKGSVWAYLDCVVTTPTEQLPGLIQVGDKVRELLREHSLHAIQAGGGLYRVAPLYNGSTGRCGTCDFWSGKTEGSMARCAVYPVGDAATCKEWEPKREKPSRVDSIRGLPNIGAPPDIVEWVTEFHRERALMGPLTVRPRNTGIYAEAVHEAITETMERMRSEPSTASIEVSLRERGPLFLDGADMPTSRGGPRREAPNPQRVLAKHVGTNHSDAMAFLLNFTRQWEYIYGVSSRERLTYTTEVNPQGLHITKVIAMPRPIEDRTARPPLSNGDPTVGSIAIYGVPAVHRVDTMEQYREWVRIHTGGGTL